MHAVKVSLAVQTFALSKCNDSGGKKSRIRRSKEERKSLVVSFIKGYQNSNNGDFPSLYLTQKEVGGSFYTVREIVREIIQENRVLGPAKFTSEDKKNDLFSEQYPLGSISTEPPSELSVPSNETYVVSNDHQVTKELVSTFSEQSTGQHRVTSDCDRYINEELVDVKYKEAGANKSLPQVNDEVLHDDPQSNKQELVSTSSEQSTGQRVQIFDNGGCNNGILMDKEGKEADASKSSAHVNDEMPQKDRQIKHTFEEALVGGKASTEGCVDASKSLTHVNDEMPQKDMQISYAFEETLGGVEISTLEEASISKVTPLATDVLVETFPLTAAELEKVRNGKPYESRDLTITPEVHETKKNETISTSGKTGTLLNRTGVVEKESSSSTAENSVGNLGDPLSEKLNHSTTGKSVTTGDKEETDLQVDVSCNDASALQTSYQNQVVAPNESDKLTCLRMSTSVPLQPKIAPSNTQTNTQRMNANKISSTSGESLSQEADVKETKTDIQDTHSTEEGKSSTLNRINLESWEGASKKPENNPVLAVFKAFITAFVKFWTE